MICVNHAAFTMEAKKKRKKKKAKENTLKHHRFVLIKFMGTLRKVLKMSEGLKD